MRVHKITMTTGITRTTEFEKKKLACWAVNCGTKCGHGCLYCSTGCILRMHPSFKAVGENPFGNGYAIVDPDTPTRVAADAQRIKTRGMVQLCTLVDAWAPEAQEYQLGRRCLEAILAEPGWTVRILTKNAAVREDFNLIERYRERVLVGLSITATEEKANLMRVVEPGASSVTARMEVLRKAYERGLRTYAMFCPMMPGMADSSEQITRLMHFAVECGVEEIFVEPVNSRGRALKDTQEALWTAGYLEAGAAVARIRSRDRWSRYVVDLISSVQRNVRSLYDINRLRILLYGSRLLPEDAAQIRKDDAGVIWL